MTNKTAAADQPEPAYDRKKSFLEDRSRRDTDRQHRWAMTITLSALAAVLAGGALLLRLI